MTPFEIDILLHYYCRVDDYREGDFSAPLMRETIDRFRDELGLLEYNKRPRSFGDYPQTYALTERGRVYVEALQNIPLPVQRWVMPEQSSASSGGDR